MVKKNDEGFPVSCSSTPALSEAILCTYIFFTCLSLKWQVSLPVLPVLYVDGNEDPGFYKRFSKICSVLNHL